MKEVLYDMLMDKIRAKAAWCANFEDDNYNPNDNGEAYDKGFADGEIAFARQILKLMEG